MHPIVRSAWHSLSYLIAPSFCVYCKIWLKECTIFCAECSALVQPIVSITLLVTANFSLRVYAISHYQEPLKSLILAKAQSQRLASYQMGNLIWNLMPIPTIPFDYIVPIPLHWTRYAYRGYNQAEVIASVLAKKSGKPMVHLLKRKKRTIFQSKLTVDQRSDNLDDAFELTISSDQYKLYYGKTILLVDDLMTTGSTLKTAAKILLKLKLGGISAVVVCRTV
jgi:ComF family protein